MLSGSRDFPRGQGGEGLSANNLPPPCGEGGEGVSVPPNGVANSGRREPEVRPLERELSDQRPLGVIRDVNGYDNLAVFPDSLVLVKGTTGYMVLRTVQGQFGVLGVLVLAPLVNSVRASRVATITNSTAADLARLNAKNQVIGANQILDVLVKKGFLGGQLVLRLADEGTRKLSWSTGANKLEDVTALLRQAVGTRLSEAA